MIKLFSKRFALTLVIAGTSIMLIGFVCGLVSLLGTYGNIDRCMELDQCNDIVASTVIAKVAMYAGWSGLILLLGGVINLITIDRKNKKH